MSDHSKEKRSNTKENEKVRGLFYMLTGEQYHPSQAVKDAVDKVRTVFNKHGVAIASENYASESSLINSLLNDFAETSIAQALAKRPVFAQPAEGLCTAQADFEIADQLWNQEKTGSSKSATEIDGFITTANRTVKRR